MKSCSGTTIGWIVEARSTSRDPQEVGGLLLGEHWTAIYFPKVREELGVPIGPEWDLPWLKLADCYAYESAQALRWWFLARITSKRIAYCIETRLRRVNITYSMDTKQGGAGHVVSFETERYRSREELPEDEAAEDATRE